MRVREIFLFLRWRGQDFQEIGRQQHSTLNNSIIEKWTFLLCSWPVFLTVKLSVLLLLMIFFFCLSVDAYNAFQMLYRRNSCFALQVCKVLF